MTSWLEDPNRNSRQIQRIHASVNDLVSAKSQKSVIIPIIESCHSYVVVIGFVAGCRKFYNNVLCQYDSLCQSGRAQRLQTFFPMVKTYKKISGTRLKISRSNKTNRFSRLYKCCEHMYCTYEILFGRHRLDGSFAVKRIKTTNTLEGLAPQEPKMEGAGRSVVLES